MAPTHNSNEPINEDIESQPHSSHITLKRGAREPQTVSVENLCFDVEVNNEAGEKQPRRLLNDVSLVFPASSLTAIMGSTGAGKTTLLNAVANRFTPTSGDIKVNGVLTRDSAMQRRLGYVMQHDKLMPTQTVRETLMFAA
eukprot:Rhum_TRINITY_DN15192_c1_g1::Rhum_TRINITY_DN15192_c1_g1_i7::g.143465::m.143465